MESSDNKLNNTNSLVNNKDNICINNQQRDNNNIYDNNSNLSGGSEDNNKVNDVDDQNEETQDEEEYSEYTNEEDEGDEEEEDDEEEGSYDEESYEGDKEYEEYNDGNYLDENDYNNSKDIYDSKLTLTQNNNTTPKKSNIAGKIFVGGLLKTTSNDTLREYFTQFGIVKESIVIKVTEKANKSRGFGFVTFIEPEVVEKVMSVEHFIEGKRVEIRRAYPKEQMKDEPKKQKLFVGGLPKHITPEDFKSYFSDYGEVLEYNLLTEKNGNVKGFGFVCFKDEYSNHVVLNETHFILGKRVDVRIADSQNKRYIQPPLQMNNNHYHNSHYQYPISTHHQKPFFFIQQQHYPQNPQTNLSISPSSSPSLNQQSIIPSPPPHHSSVSQFNNNTQEEQISCEDNIINNKNKNTTSINNNIKSSNPNNNTHNYNNSLNSLNQKHLINSPQHQHAISNYHPHNIHPFHLPIPSDPNGSYEFFHGYEPFYAAVSPNQNSSSTNSTFYPSNVVMVPVIYPYPYQQDQHSSKYYQQSVNPYYNRYYPQPRSLIYPSQYESSQQTSTYSHQNSYRLSKTCHNNNKDYNNNNEDENNNNHE